MPTNPEKFQKARLPWSKWKHAILQEYLKAMTAILRSWGEIYFVDGFAGPGKYVEDGSTGSPVLAAKHAHILAANNADYSLKCINVESVKSVFENLKESTKPYEEYVENFYGEFGTFTSTIVERIGYQPALFFLDPIGLKGLEWNSLLPILERESITSITELLIRFDAQTALRLTGGDANLHKTFNTVLGENDSRYWKEYISQSGHLPHDRRDSLSKAYEDKLNIYFPYVARMPIRSADEAIKYNLLFATRSLKGVQVMNDVFFSISDLRDRTLDEERRAQDILQQMGLFEPSTEETFRYELEVLKLAVLEVMDSGETYKRDLLRGHVASKSDNFGRFSVSQFTAVLGGRPRSITVPKDFENLKERIQIHNKLTLGNDKVEISLKH